MSGLLVFGSLHSQCRHVFRDKTAEGGLTSLQNAGLSLGRILEVSTSALFIDIGCGRWLGCAIARPPYGEGATTYRRR